MQTAYTREPVSAVAGGIARGTPEIDSAIIDGANCSAGLLVIAGTNQEDVKVPTATFSTGFRGILNHNHLHVSNDFVDNEQVSVVRKGFVWVPYEVDTVPTHDTPVYARHAANGAGKLVLGKARANADTGAVVVPGAMFRRIDSAAGLAEVELSGAVN